MASAVNNLSVATNLSPDFWASVSASSKTFKNEGSANGWTLPFTLTCFSNSEPKNSAISSTLPSELEIRLAARP